MTGAGLIYSLDLELCIIPERSFCFAGLVETAPMHTLAQTMKQSENMQFERETSLKLVMHERQDAWEDVK